MLLPAVGFLKSVVEIVLSDSTLNSTSKKEISREGNNMVKNKLKSLQLIHPMNFIRREEVPVQNNRTSSI